MITGNPMLDAALLAGLAGAVRALMAAWSQRAAVDHAKLAKNVLLGFGVGAGVAYTGLPAAEVLGALAALGVVDMAERTAKGVDRRVRQGRLYGPAKAISDALDDLRLAALAGRSPRETALGASWDAALAGGGHEAALPVWEALPRNAKVLWAETLVAADADRPKGCSRPSDEEE